MHQVMAKDYQLGIYINIYLYIENNLSTEKGMCAYIA
jgi:hypothetical protein